MNNNNTYIADTNINTLLEAGMAAEIEFQAEMNCKSAEDTYLRKVAEKQAVRLGDNQCIKMVAKPDGCLDCVNYVQCMLSEDAQPIKYGERYKQAKALKRVLNRLSK